MWRSVLMFSVLAVSAAEAGQARSSFQVGLTITGRANTPTALTQRPVSATSVPLPRPRPAAGSMPAIPRPSDPAPK